MNHIRRCDPARVTGAAVLAAILCLFSLIDQWNLGARVAAIDFFTAWSMAQNAGRVDLSNLYSKAAQGQIRAEMVKRSELAGNPARLATALRNTDPIRGTGSPFFYTVFGPLSQNTFEKDYRAFRLACWIAGASSIGLLGCMLGYSTIGCFLWLTLIVQFFDPLRADTVVGNVNQLVLAQFTVYLALLYWATRSDQDGTGKSSRFPVGWLRLRGDRVRVLAGIAIGLAIAFKPTLVLAPLLVTLGWLFRGRFRSVMAHVSGLALGSVGAFILGVWHFGSWQIWWHWGAGLKEIPDTATEISMGNYSLSRAIREQFGWNASVLLALVCLSLIILAMWRRRTCGSAADRVNEAHLACLGALVFLIASPLVWIHYLVMTIPLFMLLLRPTKARGLHWLFTALGFVLLTVNPLSRLAPGAYPLLAYLGLILVLGISLVRFMSKSKQKWQMRPTTAVSI